MNSADQGAQTPMDTVTQQPAAPQVEDPRLALIKERTDSAVRRSAHWHKVLETERRWDWRGAAVPPAISAAGVLVIALDVFKGTPSHPSSGAAIVAAVAGLLGALYGMRAYIARQKLAIAKPDQAWLAADRVAELGKSLVARGQTGTDPADLLYRSDMLEATAARYGVPQETVGTLMVVASTLPQKLVGVSGPPPGSEPPHG